MGLRIKKQRGGYRKWWYAEYWDDGKEHEMRLDVKIEGVPPASLSVKDTGDTLFERSRGRAQLALDKLLDELQAKGAAEDIMERLIISKTGSKPTYARLSDLAAMWNAIPRDRPLSDGRRRENEIVFAEFAKSCGRSFAYEVGPDDVARYFARIRTEYAWETVKSRMALLTGAFARFLPCGMQNPFKAIMKRSKPDGSDTINKVPLTDAQLQLIREKARHDEFLYPLVECAIATGARLKDICNMKWENIDLAEGFVTYRASKTSALCEIPLFDEFRSVCEGLLVTREAGEPFLFPKAQHMYKVNPSGLVYRGKKLFATALFGSVRNEPAPADMKDGEPAPRKCPADVLAEIDTKRYKLQKKERMKAVYRAYVIERKSFHQIERELKVCKTIPNTTSPKSSGSRAWGTSSASTKEPLLPTRSSATARAWNARSARHRHPSTAGTRSARRSASSRRCTACRKRKSPMSSATRPTGRP